MASFATPDITASLAHVQARQLADTSNSLVSDEDKTKMRQKSKEFESFFVYQMMELMKTETDNDFDGGFAEETFRHTLNENMAKSVVDAGGFGIADTVYRELVKHQEQRAATMAQANAAYAASAQ
ncbi:MAG: chemotactic signal-response protein chel [Alphaproteobacteria bacterium]|nr:MAG: chemotactic signal-response protein chel [Alphaproteobacteria bacterium]